MTEEAAAGAKTPMLVQLPQAGGCVCGRVRYQLNAPPLLAYACHCHDCQKRSGSAFGLTLVMRSKEISIDGSLQVIEMSTSSGRVVEHSICPKCLSRLFARAPLAPDYMSVRAGTLDDASWVRPIAQTWVASAIPWAVIPGVRAVDPAAFDFVELGHEWAASAPTFAFR